MKVIEMSGYGLKDKGDQIMQNDTGWAYCLNTSTIRACGLSIEEEIEIVAQTGYHGIELWASEIDEYVNQGRKLSELKEMLDQHGLYVPNIIAFFQWANPDEELRKKGLEEAKQILAIAQKIDCAYVAAPPSGITKMRGLPLEDIAEYYKDLLNLYRNTGVKPLLEFWGHSEILGSLDEAMQILEILDDADALLLADVFHMAKTEGSFELLNKLEGTDLGLFHMNDYPATSDITKLTDAERVYPGDGDAPLRQIVDTLTKIGYTGIFSLELFNKEYQKKGATHVVKTGIEKMKKIVSPH